MYFRRVTHGPFIVLAALSCAAAVAPPAEAFRSAGDVVTKTLTEDAVTGRLVTFSIADGLVLGGAGGPDRRIPTDDIVRLTAAPTDTATHVAPRPLPGEITLRLVGGDLLIGRITGMNETDEAVFVRTRDLGEVAIPLESLVAAVRNARSRRALHVGQGPDGATTARQAVRPYEDTIFLANGDTLTGFVTAIDPDGVVVESARGETTVALRLIAAIHFAAAEPQRLEGKHVILTLLTSGRLTVTSLNWSDDIIRATLRHGPDVLIEAERVAAADVVGGRWEWLSQHQPISYEHTPMLSLGWDYARDRNVLGQPIRVRGETFSRGIGVHSRSKLTYDLKGAYRAFVTSLALDDASGPLADVTAVIQVDGQTRFTRNGIRAGDIVGPIRIDVSGAKRIELIVDFGRNGDIQDRFNWIEAALIR
ncbi:MAG: NPCBM/NEW2 domain-containing protein [Phycisphaerae bacterium]